MITLIDSYDDSHLNIGYAINPETAVGGSFTGLSKTLDSVVVNCYKYGSPTGNVCVKIYEHTGVFGVSGIPTGAPIAVSDNISASALATGFTRTTFIFSGVNRVRLDDGKRYCIVVEHTTGDASNNVRVGVDTISPADDGNGCYYDGSWHADLTFDLIFYIYGEQTPASAEDIVSVATPVSLKTTKEINGTWSAEMTILPDTKIENESYIDIGKNPEQYVVKTLTDIKSGGKYLQEIKLLHCAIEELTAHTLEPFYITKSVSDCLDFILAGTLWTAGTCDIDETILLKSDNAISSLEALNMLAEQCGGEINYHSTPRVPDTDRIVDLMRTIGNATGLQLRYDKNCDEIKRTKDTSNLITRIYPYGPDNYTINTTYLDLCEDETLWIASGAGTVTLSNNKRYGGGAIEIASSTLNETFIHDLGAGSVKDLSGHTKLKFWIYSETDNALGFTFGIGESAYTENTVNTGALSAQCWTEIELDLSGVADASKNAIRYLGFKNLTSGSVTAIFDFIRAFNGEIYIDSQYINDYKVPKEYVYNNSARPEKTTHEAIIYPEADASVSHEFPNVNYKSQSMMTVKGYTNYEWSPHIKASLDVLPNSAVISSAKLVVEIAQLYNGGESSVDVFLLTGDFSEDTLTYNNKPAYNAVKITTVNMATVGTLEIDLTDTVKDWYNGTANYGIMLAGTSTGTNKASIIYSKESMHSPYFKVSYSLLSDPAPTIEAGARKKLSECEIPLLTYSVKTYNLSKVTVGTWKDEVLGLGDYVKVYDYDIKDSEGNPLNVNVRIKKITEDLINSANVDIELANKVYTFADLQAKIYKQLKYAMPFEDNPRIINANAIQEGNFGGYVNV